MVCNVVLLTCLLFASTFASPTVDENVARAHDSFSHPKDVQSSGVGPRIIGGKEVTPNKYPFQVALMIYKGASLYFCGGTLYSTRFVLTAAHCVDMKPDYILVVLGAHDLSSANSIETVLNTTKYVHHKDWKEDTFQNDVALVQLPKAVTLTKNIQVVEIAQGNATYAGVNGTTVGWGQTESLSLSYVLREVDSAILNNTACAAYNPEYQLLIKSMHLCSSGAGIVGSCSGDSGGPILVNGVQVGIVSFGPKDCMLGWPSVFTRLTEYHDWIVEHAKAGASSPERIQFAMMVAVALCLVRFFK